MRQQVTNSLKCVHKSEEHEYAPQEFGHESHVGLFCHVFSPCGTEWIERAGSALAHLQGRPLVALPQTNIPKDANGFAVAYSQVEHFFNCPYCGEEISMVLELRFAAKSASRIAKSAAIQSRSVTVYRTMRSLASMPRSLNRFGLEWNQLLEFACTVLALIGHFLTFVRQLS